jgi:hypothetical protein
MEFRSKRENPLSRLRTRDLSHSIPTRLEAGNSRHRRVLRSLDTRVQYEDWATLFTRVAVLDKYDRNPTSTDQDIDVDALWLRLGQEARAGQVPDERGMYVKIGKAGKFERQNDRHLESYGLAATAFNRFKNLGLELGIDLTPDFYIVGSLPSGNPVDSRARQHPNEASAGRAPLHQIRRACRPQFTFPSLFDRRRSRSAKLWLGIQAILRPRSGLRQVRKDVVSFQ